MSDKVARQGDTDIRSMGPTLSRTMTINGKRCRLTLVLDIWKAVDDMARHEGLSPTELIAQIDGRRSGRGLLRDAVMIAVAVYFLDRIVAAEECVDDGL